MRVVFYQVAQEQVATNEKTFNKTKFHTRSTTKSIRGNKKRQKAMTLKQYEEKLELIKSQWNTMPQWVKDWTTELLKEDLKEIKQ